MPIAELMQTSGPLLGPVLFVFAVLLTWAYHGLTKRLALDIADLRMSMSLYLIEQHGATRSQLAEYGIYKGVADLRDLGVELRLR